MKKTNKYKVYSFLVLFTTICISIGYSAFGTDLLISKIVTGVRIKADIRITGVGYDENSSIDYAISNYEDYNVDSINVGVSLPNETSSFTYKIKVTNFGSLEMGIFDIVGLPNNLDYEIVDYSLKNKLCANDGNCTLGVTKEFFLTIKYKDNGYDSNNIDYDIQLTFDFRKIFKITYKNITNNGYPTEILEGTNFNINFIEKAPEDIFVTGVESYTYENDQLSIVKVQDNIIISNAVVYEHPGEYVFDGMNYIDTGIYLFNRENIDKDFEVTFSILNYNETQEKFATIFNCMDEFNKDYPGLVFRVNSNMTNFEIVANNKVNGLEQSSESYTYDSVSKVKITRINNKIYYNINDGDYYELQDYISFAEYFEIPVTFGASLDENGEPFRFFDGTISNMKIKILKNDTTIESYNIAYKLKGSNVFDGTNYINTGVYLFNEENSNKDFRIKLTITKSGATQENYATLVNLLNELDSNFYGIVFRIYQNVPTEFQISANYDTKVSERFNVTDVNNVTIYRKSNIIYYSINEGELIELQDFTGFTEYFEIPVTFGASLDENRKPYRYFVGTLSNFEIRIKETI